MTILCEKKNSNTWFVNGKTFVNNTRINYIYIINIYPINYVVKI